MVRGVILAGFFLNLIAASGFSSADTLVPTRAQLSAIIDHTFLKTEKEGVSMEDQRAAIIRLVEEGTRLGAYAVCVRSNWVKLAKEEITRLGSSLKIAAVIGFPDGDAMSTYEKISELYQARADGADEFDMVIRVKALHEKRMDLVYQDVLSVANAAGKQTLKVIFENAYLSEQEKRQAYEMALTAFATASYTTHTQGPRFLKTSTGFAKVPEGKPKGATFEDVALMHQTCAELFEDYVGIKAAGGVENFEQAARYFELAGSPWLVPGQSIDPNRFRIGSSSLLTSSGGGY